MSSSTETIVSVILSHKSRLKCITEKYGGTSKTFDEAKIVKLTQKGDSAKVEYLEEKEEGYLSGGSSCLPLNRIQDIYNTYPCVNINEGIQNIIRINGNGKCGWYSIFAYLKLLYLKHPQHFQDDDNDDEEKRILKNIKSYFDENHKKNIFQVENNNSIGIDENHFETLMEKLDMTSPKRNGIYQQLSFDDPEPKAKYTMKDGFEADLLFFYLSNILHVPIYCIQIDSTEEGTTKKNVQFHTFRRDDMEYSNTIPL